MILHAAIALGFWTFCILLLVPIVRFRAALTGRAKRDDFKFGEANEVPEWVKLPNRNYMNLLELPVLFYIGCILIYLAPQYPKILINLSWLYFGLRVLHSIIHIGKNAIMPRMIVFALSNFVLLAMWVFIAKLYI
jgi:hypothetical protein